MSEDSDISYIGEKHVQASFLFERLLAHIQYRSFVCSIGLYDCDLKGRAGACKTRPTKASDVSAYFDIRVGLLDRGFERHARYLRNEEDSLDHEVLNKE